MPGFRQVTLGECTMARFEMDLVAAVVGVAILCLAFFLTLRKKL
ncbi:hypothetical protein RLDS_25735 [Sphingobium lactosutens DS20]|uniref:Uncharacterized protein n=1 Tax=Sphingobium lactosutens DS20 TaxID=1331060 RepID=T0H3C1_9SPHN|nr:hypothetical protein RLDS_25735 [Sphingobium lactosutens DS20]